MIALPFLHRRRHLAAAAVTGAVLVAGLLPAGCATTPKRTEPEVRRAPNEPWRQTRPPSGEAAPVVFPTMQSQALKSGLTVVVVEDHSLPTVHASLMVRVGSAADGKDLGVADLTWDLLDEGAGDLGAADLQNAFADLGATVKSSGGRESGLVQTKVLKEDLPRAVELLGLIATRPAFAQFDFERLQKLHVSTLTAKLGNPRAVAGDLLSARLYGEDHPYGHSADGTDKTLQKLKPATVKRFWSDHAGPKNSAVIFVGDVTMEEATALVDKAFARFRGGKVPKAPKDPKAPTSPRIAVVDFPGNAQTVVRLARAVGPAGDPQEPALTVLHEVLGGMFSSRLNMKLREEKHWTYGARSFLMRRLGPGAMGISTDIQTDHTGDAVAEIYAQLEALKTGGISEEELALAKEHFTKGLPALFALPPLQTSVAAELLSQGLPLNHYETLAAAVAAVTAADVQAAAATALERDAFVVVLAGDKAEIVKQLGEKGLTDLVVLEKSGAVAAEQPAPPAAPTEAAAGEAAAK